MASSPSSSSRLLGGHPYQRDFIDLFIVQTKVWIPLKIFQQYLDI